MRSLGIYGLLTLTGITSCKTNGLEIGVGRSAIDDNSDLNGDNIEVAILFEDKKQKERLKLEPKLVARLRYIQGRLPKFWGQKKMQAFNLFIGPRLNWNINDKYSAFLEGGIWAQYSGDVETPFSIGPGGRVGGARKLGDRYSIGFYIGIDQNADNGNDHERQGEAEHMPHGAHPYAGIFFRRDF